MNRLILPGRRVISRSAIPYAGTDSMCWSPHCGGSHIEFIVLIVAKEPQTGPRRSSDQGHPSVNGHGIITMEEIGRKVHISIGGAIQNKLTGSFKGCFVICPVGRANVIGSIGCETVAMRERSFILHGDGAACSLALEGCRERHHARTKSPQHIVARE